MRALSRMKDLEAICLLGKMRPTPVPIDSPRPRTSRNRVLRPDHRGENRFPTRIPETGELP